MSKECTLVTAYYNIGKKKHNDSDYYIWISNFLPNLDCYMVIFTDEISYNFIIECRKNFLHKTKVILLPLEKFHTFQYIEYWKRDFQRDHERYHSIGLYLIWNEKSMFVKRAIELNVFNTEYYCWADIGMVRERYYIEHIKTFPKANNNVSKEKMYVLNVNYEFTEDDFNCKELVSNRFQYKVATIGGGIIFGHKDIFIKWIDTYYNYLQEFIKNDIFAGKDQSIMACIYIKNRDWIEAVKPKPSPLNDDWFYLLYYFS
jgi:hypothetical protein